MALPEDKQNFYLAKHLAVRSIKNSDFQDNYFTGSHEEDVDLTKDVLGEKYPDLLMDAYKSMISKLSEDGVTDVGHMMNTFNKVAPLTGLSDENINSISAAAAPFLTAVK
jgi:hypothetical protein